MKITHDDTNEIRSIKKGKDEVKRRNDLKSRIYIEKSRNAK
jgi:hypothetical protein